jgi:hypothetical protein
VMETRREMWRRHNRLERVRPMILVFPEGSWRELLPDSTLQCEDARAREIEWNLRSRIYSHEHLHDDKPVEGSWTVNRAISNTGWGLEARHKPSADPTGAWAFDPVIKTRDDLHKLHYPEVTVDDERTQRDLAEAHELFDGILEIKLKGVSHISFHLMSIYTGLRGLEQVMMDMYDDPAMLHEAMAFLEQGHHHLVRQYLDLNLFSLNNDETYHSSGGVGYAYATELPGPDFDPQRVLPHNIWSSAESQELAVVSPPMHAEFVLPYEKRLLEAFALNGYGCCEDLTGKLDDVFTIPHLRRISISPFADVDRCAEKLQGDYIFSWKPHPAHLVGGFDADYVRRYIQHTLDVTGKCVIEMILKDTHTCDWHPERFTQWTDIAQELVCAG